MKDMIELDLSEDKKEIQPVQPDVDVVTVEAEFPKYTVEEILSAAKEIDTNKIATEVLVWLDVNLENYIDNHAKLFKIPLDDLDVGAGSTCDMTETKRLQSLYRGIPEDAVGIDIDSLVACRQELDKLTSECYEAMNENKTLLDKLFNRMVYYYEFRGFDKEGKELVTNLTGFVSILKFEYEAFSVGVKIREGISPENENKPESERAVLKEYVIPEGFIIWTEIAMKKSERPVGMF